MPRLTLHRCLHAVPALVVALVFGWAAWERFRLPMTPSADADIHAYLAPGLNLLLGRAFKHTFGQCFLYPGFLYAVLRVGSDFRGITVVQNLLGLGTGALLFGSWMQFRRLLPKPRLPMPAFTVLGALLAGVYLISTTSIKFERELRPESIFPFFAVLDIYCNLRFIRERFLDARPRRALLSGGGAFFFSVAAWLLKPSFSAMLLLANVPLVVSLFHAGQSVRGKVTLVLVPVLAAVLLLLWPEWKLRQGDPMGELFFAQSLFSIHANLINDQMAEDLARNAATPFPPDVVAAVHDKLTTALRESHAEGGKYWPALGFNADYLLHGSPASPPFVHWLADELGSKERRVDFCRYYYRRVWGQHPARMAAKIGRQLGVFYRFGKCPAYTNYPYHDLSEAYQRSAESLATSRELPHYGPGNALMARTEALQTSPLRIGPFPWTARASIVLSASYFVWCLWAILLGVGAWMFPPLRRVFGVAAPVLLLLYSYNFGTVLTLAIGHSLDVGRYSMYQLAYTLLAEFASVWLALEFLAATVFGLAGQEPLGIMGAWQSMSSRWISTPPLGEGAAPGLPRLVQGSAPPTVGVIILAGAGAGEDYRAAFPDARTVSADGTTIFDALEDADRDALLLIDADAGHSVAAVRGLAAAYAAAPADLIVGCDGTGHRAVTVLSKAVLGFAFGRSISDPFSGLWLCSRRFYRNVPLCSGADARALELAWTVQAFDEGFSIRETRLPDTPVREDARTPSFGDDASVLRGLLGWSVRCRPLRMLGVLGLALLLLGGWLGYAPLRDAGRKKHHADPFRLTAAAVLLAAGLLGLHAGLLLDGAAYRRREDCQLRLRGKES